MNGSGLTQAISVALLLLEAVLALIALVLLVKKHALGQYKSLTAILMLMLFASVVNLIFPHLHPTDRHLLYSVYFYWFWSAAAVETILMLVFCHGILMRVFWSFPKLQSISTRVFWLVVFLWVAASVSFDLIPPISGARLVMAEGSQLRLLEGGVSFLAALVVFACIRSLGLELRSRLPGFGLGLMFFAMNIFSTRLNAQFDRNWVMIFVSLAICAQLLSWIAAVSWPEPAREVVRYRSGYGLATAALVSGSEKAFALDANAQSQNFRCGPSAPAPDAYSVGIERSNEDSG